MRNKRKGITAIEILFAVGIVGIMMTIVVSSFSQFRNASLVNTESLDIVSFINNARLSSMSSVNDLQYGVHFDSDKVVMYSTAVYSASDSTNVVRALNTRLNFTNIAIQGGGSDVIFRKVTGDTGLYATTTMKFLGSTATSTIFVIRPSGVAVTY